MKPIAAILIVAASALAQNAPVEALVQGAALDRFTRAPIGNARVNVSVLAPGRSPEALQTATDGGGRFSARVPQGAFITVNVIAGDYEPGRSPQQIVLQDTPSIEVLMSPLLDLRGRVVDEESRKPIPGLSLDLLQADTPAYAEIGVVLQEDGNFIGRKLGGGDYFLRFKSTPYPEFQEIPALDLAGEKREKALEVPEPAEGYGIVVWPGESAEIPSTAPFRLSSNGADVGEIRLRRYQLHNFSGVLSDCQEGAYLQLLLYQKRGTVRQQLASMDTRCGAGFRLLNVPDGNFTLVAQGGPPRMFTSQPIDSSTRGPLFLNVASIVSVQILVDVDGLPSGTVPDGFRMMGLAFTPESAPVNIDAPDRISPVEYEAHVFGGEGYRLSIMPPPAYYLRQVLYNGVPLDDLTTLAVVPASLSSMRLLLSSHPGSADVRASSDFVYLVKDGSRVDLANMNTSIFKPAFSGGVLHFTGLAPGKYHAFTGDALSQAAIDEGLKHATDVTVEEDQTVTVDLTHP